MEERLLFLLIAVIMIMLIPLTKNEQNLPRENMAKLGSLRLYWLADELMSLHSRHPFPRIRHFREAEN